MTDPTEAVSGLIERIEAAGERCAYLDAAIEVIIRPEIFLKKELISYGRAYLTGGLNRADWRYLSEIGVRQYTGSIDAAMTLVDPRALWAHGSMEDGPFARLCWPQPDGTFTGGYHEANCATVPLSICAAALKAKAIEARRAATGTGAVHESAVAASDAPNTGDQHDQ